MAYSIGTRNCENDITHETCDICGECSSCREIEENEQFNDDEIMEMYDACLSENKEASASEFRNIFANAFSKKTRMATNFQNMPLCQLFRVFKNYVLHETKEPQKSLHSEDVFIEDVFISRDKSFVKFDVALRDYLIDKIVANRTAIDKAYYVNEPDFTYKLNEHDNERLFEAVILFFDEAKLKKSTLLSDFSNHCPVYTKLSVAKFNKFYIDFGY